MINREHPKSAVVERMGLSAAFVWQFCAVTKGNFRNIQASSLASQLCMVVSRGAEGQRGRGERTCISLSSAPLLPCSPADLHPAILGWRTARARVSQLERVLSKEFRGENR
ncbi:hypothetical protein [Nostoc foliaceum]|uniref:Uncharacterized protein n=1 Tax=Nostoc linckia FACHB-391 TaxID=2692906 RepID=A0ABR8F4U5_NOSLI|nr:hypothetical protein [Nostoc foliaceum]MBD2564919.1 hypothetical protein [Nostoc linckia FACHB-391]